MTQPDPNLQTPPSKILFPLGAAFIILPILGMTSLDLGPVSTVMMIVLIVMGVGIVWQGTKNLKREKT